VPKPKPTNMKTSPLLNFTGRAMKWVGVPAAFVLMGCAAQAQINPADPALRLWLKADTLSGPAVPVWTDSSTNATTLAAPPLPPGDTANDPVNHIPVLVTVTNNGLVFNAVQFRQAYDPITPDPVHGHLADRLWQTNNLGANDPALIDPSSDITMILVYKNNAPNTDLGPDQTIVAKRGPSACPWELGLNASLSIPTAGPAPDHIFVTYAGATAYGPGPSLPSQPEWGIVIMNITSGGVMNFNQFYRSLGGWATGTMTGVGRGAPNPGDPDTFAFHTQAAGATAGNPWGNGAYERFAGLIAEFALYNRSLSSNELAGVQNALLAKYFLQPGPPVIVTQPKSQQVDEFDPVTFTVLAEGTPPFAYQWLNGTSAIPGANDWTYTIPSATNGGSYSVIVSNSISYTNSQAATLTVIPYANPPAVTSALLNYLDNTSVTVAFSELVNPDSATNIANYNINNGVTITGAVIGQTNNTYWSNYVSSVVLATTPVTSQSTLTVNGVQDRAGNSAVNAMAVIVAPGVPAPPPSANRLLWLSADQALLADSTGVYEWDDQAGAANAHNALYDFGNAQPGQIAFPNALHPVVSFDGTCALALENTADFNLQTITIYLVGDLDGSKTSDDFIANWGQTAAVSWEGFVLGGSDSVGGALKWSTGGADIAYHPIDPSPVLGNRVPTLIAAAFANPGNQTLALNTVQVAVLSKTVPINYADVRGMTIGALFPSGAQNLFGDIAEILIYSSVSPAQDAAVQNYLIAKYFAPSATAVELVSATSSTAQNNRVTVVFSGPVSHATAANASNYAINHGVTVNAVSVMNGTTVKLATSALNSGPAYTLTVNGVTNWAGDTILPNSQVVIGGIPPRLDIARPAGGPVAVSWDPAAPFKLQSAAQVTAPWSYVTGATNPYVVTPTNATQFYRLSQ
jgi:hypothetical protein